MARYFWERSLRIVGLDGLGWRFGGEVRSRSFHQPILLKINTNYKTLKM
ncbi:MULTISPECIES: hypothetical protein [Kamptonema]|nr:MULTISPECIES: hypothetical protein [Kamptonema]